MSLELNWLDTNNRIWEMLDSKDFEALDLMSPLLGAFLDRGTAGERAYPMTRVQTMFHKLDQWVRQKVSEVIVSDEIFRRVRVEVQKSRALMKETPDAHCERGCIL